MLNSQTNSTAELDGTESPPDQGHAIVLAQAQPLATLHSSAPETVIPATLIDNYRPVDNHRALVNGWKRLSPAQQWLTGGCLGLTLGFGVMAWVNSMQKAVALAPSPLSHTKTTGRTHAALKHLYQRTGEVRAPMVSPESVTPASAVQPMLQPVIMDRFYLPVQAAADGGPTATLQSAIVVDRFYFDPHQRANASPDTPAARSPEIQPLAVPLPPPSPQAFSQAPVASAAVPHGQNAPHTPTLSDRPAISQPSSPPTMAQATPVAAPVSQNNRLLGVVQTGQFSAALVQTGQNSYAIRLGDRISQSPWQLVDVQDSSVTLSRDSERLTIHVGDSF